MIPVIGLSSLVSAGGDRARPQGRPARLRGQVRPPGPDRGAQGADRRHGLCGVSEMMTTTDDVIEYVTATIGGQLFGLPISRVQDVFVPDRLTRVPLAAPEIAGMLNLRGRIVTAIDMRRRLGLPPRGSTASAHGDRHREQGRILRPADRCDRRGDEAVGRRSRRATRSISIARLARVSAGVYRLDGNLLVVLDVDRVLDSRRSCRSGVKRTTKRSVNSGGDYPHDRREEVMKTCLVVDDSSVIRKVARRILEGLEFEIAEAEDGEQALEVLPWQYAGRSAARLEHAEDGRLRVPASRCARCRAAIVPRWCSAPPRTTSPISRGRCMRVRTNTS